MTEEPEIEIDLFCVTDHAEACAELLERYVYKLATGTCPEDIAHDIILIGRIMARNT